MFRLLGFLIGSLTSVVIILLIIGMPTFHLQDEEAAQQRYDAAIEKLRAKQEEIASVAGRLTEEMEKVTGTLESAPVTRPATPEAMPEEAPTPVAPVAAEPATASEAVEAPPNPEQHWFSFWNPFRSEIAANGFVSQLERVTGMDYRVVRVKSGVYEVAFAYTDDAERIDKLSRIAAATGLDLPESR